MLSIKDIRKTESDDIVDDVLDINEIHLTEEEKEMIMIEEIKLEEKDDAKSNITKDKKQLMKKDNK